MITKVVAMGGRTGARYLVPEILFATAEILDLSSIRWQNLPDLPFAVALNGGVESIDGPYLAFSVRGWDGKRHRKKIIGLRKNQNGYNWNEVIGLANNDLGRSSHAVVNAPKVLSC